MENKSAFILFSTLLLSCFVARSSCAKKRNEAFSRFILNKEGITDRSLFKPQDQQLDVEDIVYSQEGIKEKDMIKSLPGQPFPVAFNQYGGYVTVDRNAGRALFYYFVEAENSPNTLPLLLWFNGGPGCSSLAYGAMEELGPFRVHSDGKTLYQNEFAWNRVANVLFLESPAGVGFSYSNTTADVKAWGDQGTATDNYAFLLNWLERFPEYKKTDFYISGESYAGHFVPQLAHTILQQNQKAERTNIINLKGIIIGNAAINDETDHRGMYEYFGSHALISDDTAHQIAKHCDFSPNVTKTSDECNIATTKADKVFGQIDIYNIYAPLCSNSNLTDKPKAASIMTEEPCSDSYVHAYLNRAVVQKALHANVTNIPNDWEACSYFNWTDSPYTVIPLLKELMKDGVRVWIFSGDIDGRVPVTSTQLSLKEMNLPTTTPWYPWYSSAGEVGGYTSVYDHNLTFATVRGAGHAVPSYRPDRALILITHFFAGEKLPKS